MAAVYEPSILRHDRLDICAVERKKNIFDAFVGCREYVLRVGQNDNLLGVKQLHHERHAEIKNRPSRSTVPPDMHLVAIVDDIAIVHADA